MKKNSFPYSSIEDHFKPTPDKKCSVSSKGMVATAFPLSTQAGVEILKIGGNAVDAACASALALGVCEPQASGIGGQTMAVLHINGKTIAIDGSSRVPSLAHQSCFKKGEKLTGYRATTVPSTLAVLGHLNFRYGKLSWDKIVRPAIKIARKGYQITPLQNRLQNRELSNLLKGPSCSGAKYFLKKGSKPYQAGDIFVQKDLADCLEQIAKKGPRDFYVGEIAAAIDKDMQENNGFLRAEDLALIPWPVERKPIYARYRRIRIATMPPPAAGRVLLLVLMMLDHLPSRVLRKGSKEAIHFMAETFRKSFLLRTQRPFDPNTYPQEAHKIMINRTFARMQAKSIRDKVDPNLPLFDPLLEETDTTHLSVMDIHGNAIGITQSIERVYGSKTAAKGLGFLYNNYMMALETENPEHPYYLRPNAVPWTTVAPAIAFYQGQPWLVIGSPGSERIFSTVSQFLINMIDRKINMGEAMRFPRLHCSIGGTISLESGRFDSSLTSYLKEMGYKLKEREDFAFYLGAIHAVMKCFSKNEFHGVAEVRRDGTAGGP